MPWPSKQCTFSVAESTAWAARVQPVAAAVVVAVAVVAETQRRLAVGRTRWVANRPDTRPD